MKTQKVALVTLLSGVVADVVVGADPAALEERGRGFVEEQGCNAEYHLRDLERLGFYAREETGYLALLLGVGVRPHDDKVVVGSDRAVLEALGDAWVEQQDRGSYHIADVEALAPERPAVFHPYINPEVTVEILQSRGTLHLIRQQGHLAIALWHHPRNAEPDPWRPGHQRELEEDKPLNIFKLCGWRLSPQQWDPGMKICCTVFENFQGMKFYFLPETIARLLTLFGFDPAPLWADIKAAGGEVAQ